MHRIDTHSATPDQKFTEGDPTIPVPPTQVSAHWLNAVQEEVAHAVESTGQALNKQDNTQLTKAITILASGGRVQRAWRLEAPIVSGGTLNIPPEVAYTAGAGALMLIWDGIVLTTENYSEIGNAGASSMAVKLLFDAPAKAEFCAVLTAAGGGAVGVNIPPDVRQRLDAAIARADAAAQSAEDATARMGDTFYAVPQ